MKKKKVKIAGKQVWLAYCYATEIIFNDLTGEDINEYFKEVFFSGDGKSKAAQKKLLYAILACAIAYSQGTRTEDALDDKALMYEAKPSELIEAFKVVVELHNEWYKLPSSEKPEKEEGEGEKN